MTMSLKDAGTPAGRVTEDATRVWAGRGTGKPCECCGKAIPAEDVQYDLEVTETLAAVTNACRGRTLSFHLSCYDQWRDSLMATHKGRG